jgi:hypothetical protein
MNGRAAADPRLDACHGAACTNPVLVTASSGNIGESVPLCLSCLHKELEPAGPGLVEIALRRRSGDRLEGFVSVAEVLATLPATNLRIRVGVTPVTARVADFPNDVSESTDVGLGACTFGRCASGAIALVNPMLRPDEVQRACKRHLVPILVKAPNPEVRPAAPWLLPQVGETLASLAENILAIQIFFELPGCENLESSPAGGNSPVHDEKVPGDRPLLIF